jgi:hypothetical protein
MYAKSRWPVRILCLTALIGVSTALALLVMHRPADGVPAVQAGDEARLIDLGRRAERVGVELGRLAPGRRARAAQRAVHAAVGAAEPFRKALGSDDDERLVNALDRELEYLDAVGSLLSNPRSPLASEVADRGRRARAAFGATPGGLRAQRATRGWTKLLAYAKARRGE